MINLEMLVILPTAAGLLVEGIIAQEAGHVLNIKSVYELCLNCVVFYLMLHDITAYKASRL